MDTFKAYQVALQNRYRVVRNGAFANFLMHPSQGKLRDLCALKCADASAVDLEIFRAFLGFEYGDSRNRLKQSRDRFKPLSNFLHGKSNLADIHSADMLAFLVDFEHRPYRKFLKMNPQGTTDEQLVVKELKPIPRMRANIWLSAIPLVAAGSFFIGADNKDCMKWTGRQYVRVDCEPPGHPVDTAQFVMRQIIPNAKTVFFRDGLPVLFYGKYRGRIEFFDRPGYHPQTRQPLKPVTTYLARRYRKSKSPNHQP